MAQYHHKC